MSVAQKRKTCFYRPPNFDPKIHLPAELRHLEDSAVYLMHLIYQAKAIQRLSWKTYVPLMADFLREVIPEYKVIRQALVDNQVLDPLLPAVKGVHSMGHRFHPDMIGRFAMYEPRDNGLVQRYHNARRRTDNRIKWSVHKHLAKWLVKVEIDHKKAQATAARLYAVDPQTYGNQCLLIDMISSRNAIFTVDDFGNRVHTPITSMSSGLRPHLTIEGQHLVGVDVSCSQPYFLALVLLNAWLNGDKVENIHGFTLPKMDESASATGSPFPKPKSLFSTIQPLLSLPYDAKVITREDRDKSYDAKNQETLANPALKVCSDLTQFARDILDGSFYDNLIPLYHKASRRRKPPTRGDIKDKVFGSLYCHPRDHGAMWRILEGLYPTAMSILASLKTQDYTRVSRAMQRQESWVMLGCIVRDLKEDHPHIPVVTIHDSILTTAEHVETVEKVMLANFDRLGLIPNLKTTPYEPKSSPPEPRKPTDLQADDRATATPPDELQSVKRECDETTSI